MAERFLVSIDFKNIQNSNSGFDLKTISYLDRVHITVTPETLQDAADFLHNLEDIIFLLNSGATKAFVTYWQLKAVIEDRLFTGENLERLVVSFDHSVCEGDPENGARRILGKMKAFVPDVSKVGIQVHDVHDWTLLDAMHRIAETEDYPSRYVTLAYNTRDHYVKAIKDGVVAVVPATKIMEEASELCGAVTKQEIAAEAADLLYFALTKCVASDVTMEDIEHNLDLKATQITRRTGNAKEKWAKQVGLEKDIVDSTSATNEVSEQDTVKEAASIPKAKADSAGFINERIQMRRYDTAKIDHIIIKDALQRPSQRSTDQIMNIVKPIIKEVRENGDAALLKYTHKFDKATSLTSPVLHAPFPRKLMELPPETIKAIDISYENIRRFHAAQKEEKPLHVETMPGVVCSRFSRPIERVGLYVPGGTAVLPSTALMLGVPAMVAGCNKIVLASPPRSDGTITPEIVYVAHKVGAKSIVLAGGAQAVAAMAYGTESITKVDKILGPGNQFVTAGKMLVSNDTTAGVSIDMPAGPSEVLVIADKTANPAFVASDLLSQAEHGTDSQVILIAVDLGEEHLTAIEDELHAQANVLPRKDIVRGAIEHSVTLLVKDIEEAMIYSNEYAPEHLILQVKDPESVVSEVDNAGSVFVGPWTPESVGDYSAGVNHSLLFRS
ncbi:histidinol dehydrogenase, partial [Lecanoromycetidae sp. Uapishka_2]